MRIAVDPTRGSQTRERLAVNKQRRTTGTPGKGAKNSGGEVGSGDQHWEGAQCGRGRTQAGDRQSGVPLGMPLGMPLGVKVHK
jgi:hypothetical protein